MMNEVSPTVNIPVRSLQTFLRRIATEHNEVPMVIPDGRYGEQTGEAVRGFQQKFGLPVTGEADHDTWQRVVEVYRDTVKRTAEPKPARIYPSHTFTIRPGEQSENLYAIQGMMLPLTHRYPNLGELTVNGVHDEQSTACVRRLQRSFGQEESGVIDKAFWDLLADLYAAQVPPRKLRPAGSDPEFGDGGTARPEESRQRFSSSDRMENEQGDDFTPARTRR